MLTKRALFKVICAFGLGTLLPSKIFGETLALARISSVGDSQGPSAVCQPLSQARPGETTSPYEIEVGEDLLDSVDCRELAEQYGSFEKGGGYLGGYLYGTCLFCHAGVCSVYPNEFRCFECGISGTTLDFFAKIEGITDEEAMRRLAMLVKSGTLQRRRNEQQMLWGIMSEASRYYHHLLCDTAEGVPGQKLLEEQGVTAQVREKLYLGYFPRCHNGIKSELLEHLVARGYETDIVQSVILPSGYPGILLPVRDAHGHCWGLLKSPFMANDELMWGSSLLGMQRLAPHLFQRIGISCPVETISAIMRIA